MKLKSVKKIVMDTEIHAWKYVKHWEWITILNQVENLVYNQVWTQVGRQLKSYET